MASLTLVITTPAIIADKKPGKSRPASFATALSFSPMRTASARTSTVESKSSIGLEVEACAGGSGGVGAKVTSASALGNPCSSCRWTIQPVTGPETSAPTMMASVAAPTATTGAF